LQTPLRRLQLPEGLCPCPPQAADRCSVDGRDLDRSEVPGAQEPGQLQGVPPVGLDPVAWLLGEQGGGDHPADVALLRQGTIEPGAAGTGGVDAAALLALGRELPDALGDRTLPGPNRAAGDNLGPMVLGAIGESDGLFRPLHADGERGRLCQG
jgi:hypothetical protein